MNYKLAVFDMDGTLLADRTIFALARHQGIVPAVAQVLADEAQQPYEKTIVIAALLRCTTVDDFTRVFRSIPLRENAQRTVTAVKRAGLKTAIATDSYGLAARDLKERLGMNYVFANEIVVKNGHLTGHVILHNKNAGKKRDGCDNHSICKRDVLLSLCETLAIRPEEAVAVGDGHVDRYMIEAAGLGVAMRHAPDAVRAAADVVIDDLIEILKYL
jgi:phosphoserine phosphatase